MYTRADITVCGKVQGVGFRFYTLQEAQRLSLCGTVKNQYDGSVFITVEGERSLVFELIKSLRIGPRFSNVKDVSVEYDAYKNEYVNFTVK